MKYIFFLAVTSLLTPSCSSPHLDVNIEGLKISKDKLDDVKNIGIAFDADTPKKLRENIFKSMSSCRPFNSVVKLDTAIDISKSKRSDLNKQISKSIGKNVKARQLHSLLTVNTLSRKSKKKLEKSTIFRFSDKKDYAWGDSYGTPSAPLFGLAKKIELVPKRKVKRTSTFIRSTDYIYKIKYALINQIKGKVIQAGNISTKSTLSVYSRKPRVRPKKILDSIYRSFTERLHNHLCAHPSLQARIYKSTTGNTTGKLINEGFYLAKDGKWDLASSKWKAALIKEPQNDKANHNMGIFYEMVGEPQKAFSHYSNIKQGVKIEKVKDQRYKDFVRRYMTPHLQEDLFPQISYISSGNWVFIKSNNKNIKRRSYPIFRLEMNRGEVDQEVLGIHIREIGSLVIDQEVDGYYMGRIKEMVTDYPILPGDYIFI